MNEQSSSRNNFNNSLILALLGGAALLSGCSRPPQVSKENRKLVETVLTAVSSGNVKWLSSNEKVIHDAHEKGELSDAEFDAFSAVLAQARDGDWKGATAKARALSLAQQSVEDDANHHPIQHKKPK